MTGPRTFTVHPLPRRPWLLLPLSASVAFLLIGCSDQLTEPVSNANNGPAAMVSHPLPKPAASRMAASRTTAPKPLVSFGIAQSTSGNGPSVLVLADTDVVSTNALANSLADSGVQVTLRPAPEWTWDGTNPSLTGFDVVIHLNGATYDMPLPTSAQNALTSFVSNGGGFVASKWDGYEPQPDLSELVLLGHGGDPTGPEQNCSVCQVTYEQLPAGVGHPVLEGLSSSFSFTADAHDAGPATPAATVLMQVPSGGPAVLVREYGSGRVVNFSIAPNYQWDDNTGVPRDPTTLQDPTVQKLYLNAVRWAAGSGSGAPQPQTITFGPIADRVYGDPPFTLDASASSGLPVSYSSTGPCSVLGTTATLSGAGSCTITAHQAGNDSYEPAPDVSQSFTIAKAPATMTVGTEYTYDGTVKSAVVTTSPAGLSGVSVTYAQGGIPVTSPINAGTYDVTATLDNPNYTAAPATGTLTINQATPAISWTPGAITAGVPLGSSHLNAVARGVEGAVLSGAKTYTPPAGTMLSAGPATLSVQFSPDDANYTAASKTVSVTVLSGMTFSGFYAPVKNLPMINVATAGSAIPMKFSVGGYMGLQILGGEPTSVMAQCGSGIESSVGVGTLAPSGLRALGSNYTYVWKTNPAWAGTCRKFVLTLADGSIHEALFRFPAKRGVAIGRRIIRGR